MCKEAVGPVNFGVLNPNNVSAAAGGQTSANSTVNPVEMETQEESQVGRFTFKEKHVVR